MSIGVAVLVSMAMAASGEPDWSNLDFMYRGRVVANYQTEPGTWADETAFGLRMGMGPGDLGHSVPTQHAVIVDTDVKEGQAVIYDDKVGGLSVKVFLHFLRGRLYSIKVVPSYARTLSGQSDFSAEGMERNTKARWTWTRDVLRILSSELGKPACAPSERTIERFCFNVRPLPGCGPPEFHKDKLFRWVWRNGRTETMLLGETRLEYRDLEAMTRVTRAKVASRREWEAQEAAKKAADRAKLAGAASGEGEVAPRVESGTDASEDNVAEPPPLECYADEDEPSKDQRTDRTSWSRVGWDQYRWGMGPGDVKHLLSPVKEESLLWYPGTRDAAHYLLLGTKVLAAPSSATFEFVKGRLSTIKHQPNCGSLTEKEMVDCLAWSRQVESTFNKRCGDGRCTRDGKYTSCSWACGEAERASLTRYDSGDFHEASLSYVDPASVPRRALAGTLKVETPENSWSPQGWFGFQYGMGPADVQRRIMAAGGEFRAKRQMACVVSKDNPKYVECVLERDFHQMSVVGLKPTLTFSFLDSRLYGVSLQFPTRIEQTSFDRASERLHEMLVDKYGSPTQDFSYKIGPKQVISLQWDDKDLIVDFMAGMPSDSATMFVSYFSNSTHRELKHHGHGSAEGAKL